MKRNIQPHGRIAGLRHALTCGVAAILLSGLLLASPAWGAAAAKSDGGHAAESHEPEGPITAKSLDKDLAFWSLVTFVLFLIVLKKMAWGPLIQGLDKREAGIAQNIADAGQAKIVAERLLSDYKVKIDKALDEAREIVAEGRRDGESTKREILAEAQKEADLTRQRAVQDIERARDAAIKELFDAAAMQVAAATEHVLGRSLNDDDQNRLIREALTQFSRN